MKKLLLLFIITSIFGYSQERDSITVSAEFTTVFPVGSLATKYDHAKMVGFWFKVAQEKNIKAHFGFNLLLLNDPSSINYRFKDSTFQIKSGKYGLDFGVRASKNIELLLRNSRNSYVEIESTLGIHYLDYDFPKLSEEEKKANNENDVLENTTFLAALGCSYMYKNVGFKIQYRFTPMNIISEIDSNFGSSSFGIGIVYKQ